MRVGEALRLFASLHPDPRPLDELVEEWNLAGLLRRPFAGLSGGERQRLFVALALVGRPEVVFLDELTQNLDPSARRQTWDVVRRIRDRGTTVVLVTHDVEEAERVCDRVVVLHRGRLVADGPPPTIVEALGGVPTVRFTDADLDVRPLRSLPGVSSVQRHGPEVAVTGSGPVLAHVGAHLVAAGRPAARPQARPPHARRPLRHPHGGPVMTASPVAPCPPPRPPRRPRRRASTGRPAHGGAPRRHGPAPAGPGAGRASSASSPSPR